MLAGQNAAAADAVTQDAGGKITEPLSRTLPGDDIEWRWPRLGSSFAAFFARPRHGRLSSWQFGRFLPAAPVRACTSALGHRRSIGPPVNQSILPPAL
jgi:hypothetical protein